MAPGILFPELEIVPVVLWLEVTGSAVIAALNDMAEDALEDTALYVES